MIAGETLYFCVILMASLSDVSLDTLVVCQVKIARATVVFVIGKLQRSLYAR